MNTKFKSFLSNFSITLFSNLLSMLVSSLIILIIPAFVSVKDYGYWQLFVFYCSYTSYLSFGITDGVYIRNGGKRYEDVQKNKIRSQYLILFIMNIILSLVLPSLFFSITRERTESLIIFFACLSAVIIIPRSLITMTLLSVNRIKENAIIIIVDRSIYLASIVLLFLFKVNNFYFIIIADLFGQLVSSVVAILMCKELVVGRIGMTLKEIFNEIRINFSIGIKIVIAGLASMLIVGIVRIGIEQNWGVEEFAKVSLTLSICNMLLVFIKAISVVIFPMLCNSDNKTLKKVYVFSKDILSILLFTILLFYYPIKIILSAWLPTYSSSLMYMAFLFPIGLYESKTQLLLNTYYKALRKEKQLLYVNVLTVILSLLFTFTSTTILKSIDFAIFSISLLLAFRCYFLEYLLFNSLELYIFNESILEIIVCLAFVIFNWFIGGSEGMLLYLLVFIIFLFFKRDSLNTMLKIFKKLICKRGNKYVNKKC